MQCCDRQTLGRQTNKQTNRHSIHRASMASRCKNVTLWLITFNLPSNKAGISGFGWLKCKLGGRAWSCIAIMTFAREARPDEISACPMFDLTEPMSSGPDLPLLQNTSATLFDSCMSPITVPVPWSSINDTVDGLTAASLYTSRNNLRCISPDG